MVYNRSKITQDWLLPSHCALCLAYDPSGLSLCPDCRDDLPWLEIACPRCARPLASDTPAPPGQLCGACQQRPPRFDSCMALFHYAPPVDRLILQLKFAAGLHLARLFAAMLATRLADHTQPECVIPIPLHPQRQRARGFNQAVEIARPLTRHLGCRLDIDTCIRTRATPPQSQLSGAQRRHNLRNAFALTRPLQARHIALLDDVMTTGTTLDTLAGLLRHAGAERIDVWVCARTHHDR